jgi:hypothetical protein
MIEVKITQMLQTFLYNNKNYETDSSRVVS